MPNQLLQPMRQSPLLKIWSVAPRGRRSGWSALIRRCRCSISGKADPSDLGAEPEGRRR